MKQTITLLIALAMVLSLTACGNQNSDPSGETTMPSSAAEAQTECSLTAQEVGAALKEKLGESYGCSVADEEAKTASYFGLNMENVESWMAESHPVPSVNMDQVVILKVKDGYAGSL